MKSTAAQACAAAAAAGVLPFDAGGQPILVNPTDKPGWDIPGGYPRPGETPTQAARREIGEEPGAMPPIGRLLVVDRAPRPEQGEKVLFVFDTGPLTCAQVELIRPDRREIGEVAFHDPSSLAGLVTPRLGRRIAAAVRARERTVHLVYGVEQ